MAALTAARSTLKLGEESSLNVLAVPVKAAAVIYAGAMVGVDATGCLVPVITSTTIKVLGRAVSSVDNTSGASGAVTCEVRCGCFGWDFGSAGDALTQADAFATVYASDDHTVNKTDGGATRSAAGFLVAVSGTVAYVMHTYK